MSRFDKAVWHTLAALGLLTALLAWSGEQRGVTMLSRIPPPDAQEVSTRTSIQITFDRLMDITRWSTESASLSRFPLLIEPYVAGRLHWNNATLTLTPSLPLAADTIYTITLPEELRSLQGRPIAGERQWQFTTRRPWLLYLASDQNDVMQLTMLNLETNQEQHLTHADDNVLDYAVSPDSTTIIYTVPNEDRGADIWNVELESGKAMRVLKCGDVTCRHAVWSSNDARVVYERTSPAERHTRLWWLDVEQGETLPVFEDAEQAGYGAGWSADGTWLSYIDPVHQELCLHNLKDGRSFGLPNQMGEPPVWHPRSNSLVFSDVLFRGEAMPVHLFRLDPEQGTVEDISGDLVDVRDHSPTWSPDGTWLACSRQSLGANIGRQLVMMHLDDSDVFPLTRDPLFEHVSPIWSPDDRAVIFQRFSIHATTVPPELWLADVRNGRLRRVASSGKQAAWLP